MAKVKVLAVERNNVELDYQEEANPATDILESAGVASTSVLHLEDSVGDIPLDKIRDRAAETHPKAFDNSAGSLEFTDLGALQFSISAGNIWAGYTKYQISLMDTSATGTFTYIHRNGSGGFVQSSGQTAFDNTRYDNGPLANSLSEYYVNHWLYIRTTGEVYVVYGTGAYLNLNSSKLEPAPSDVPAFITTDSFLRYRVTVQEGSTSVLLRKLGDASVDYSSGEADASVDLLEAVRESVLEKTDRNTKNILALALEMASLVVLEDNPNLTFFVDSFETAEFIDNSSSNYAVNQELEYVSLVEGGNLSVADSTLGVFNQGTFTNTESFDDGGTGALRKGVVSNGGIIVLNNFSTTSGVTTTGDSTQSLTADAGNYRSAESALQISADFSDTPFNATSTTTVDLGGSFDLTIQEFINLYYIKREAGPIDYVIRVEDNVAATYDFAPVSLTPSTGYSTIQKPVSSITGIDLTNVTKIHFILNENGAGQTVLDVPVAGVIEDQVIDNGTEIDQTFSVAVSSVVKRIKLRLYKGASVTEKLHVAITNFFGTTLGTAEISAANVAATATDYVLDFDQHIQLQANGSYRIQFRTNQVGGGGAYDYEVISSKNTSVYADGAKLVNGVDSGEDIFFTLFTEAPSENIYIDDLELEGASIFQGTGTYLSRKTDFGTAPSVFNLLYWTEVLGVDDIEVRLKSATTSLLLDSATWSSWFTDPTGAGNNIAGVTPARWMQYEVRFTGGVTSSSGFIDDISLDYTLPSGSGSAEVISISENTGAVPEQFMLIWELEVGTGTANFYVTRDGGTSWQAVTDQNNGSLISYASGVGTEVKARVILTGNAKVYGWGLAADQEFL